MEYLIPYMELDNALWPEKLFWIFPSLFNFAWGWKLSLCGGIWVSFHNMILEISIFSLFALSTYLQSLRLIDPRLSGSDRYLGRFSFWFVEMWNPNSIFFMHCLLLLERRGPMFENVFKIHSAKWIALRKNFEFDLKTWNSTFVCRYKRWVRPPPQSMSIFRWSAFDTYMLKLDQNRWNGI